MSLAVRLVSLARAKTQQDRIRVLEAVSFDKRFNPDQQAELRVLLEEARKVPDPRIGMLRPILNPARVCDILIPLNDGPKPVLSAEHEIVVDEWCEGWVNEALLTEKGATPPGPLLLSGPTGCGKSTLVAYLAARLRSVRAAVVLEAHKSVSSFLGETGAKLSKAFEAANANSGFVVLEEIDALAETRATSEAGSGAERENNRTSVAMMRLIEGATCAIVATTNRLSALDPALLRRFEFKINYPAPSEAIRAQVLGELLGALPPPDLLALDLNESVPLVRRVRRLQALRNLSVSAASEIVLAA